MLGPSLRLGLTVVAVSPAGLAMTAILGYLIIKRSLRPLEEVAAVASSVAPAASGAFRRPGQPRAARVHQ